MSALDDVLDGVVDIVTDELRAELAKLRAELDKIKADLRDYKAQVYMTDEDNIRLRADVETWKKYYYDVADAITSGSTSPTDLCNQARRLRAELDKKDAALEEAKKVIKFYGTPENWVNDHVDIGVGNMPIPETSECGHDMGRKASAWLSAQTAPQEEK